MVIRTREDEEFNWAETRRFEVFVIKNDKWTETLMIEDDASLIEVGEGDKLMRV